MHADGTLGGRNENGKDAVNMCDKRVCNCKYMTQKYPQIVGK